MNDSAQPTCILIVEDDADTAEFFVDLLEMEGYQTRIAASGRVALELLVRQQVQLVLLDYRLPDMKGLEVCRRIRASIDSSLPILLLTADREPRIEAEAIDAGITAFLKKPTPVKLLLEQIAALLGASAACGACA